jgi:hypothetical protein
VVLFLHCNCTAATAVPVHAGVAVVVVLQLMVHDADCVKLLVILLFVLLVLLVLLLLLLFTAAIACTAAAPAVQAEATAVFPDRQLVEARSVDGVKFYIGYNKLAICTGSQVNMQQCLLRAAADAVEVVSAAAVEENDNYNIASTGSRGGGNLPYDISASCRLCWYQPPQDVHASST